MRFVNARFEIVPPPEVAETTARMVESSGCPQCGIVAFGAPYVCEHGVVTPPDVELSFTLEVDGRTLAAMGMQWLGFPLEVDETLPPGYVKVVGRTGRAQVFAVDVEGETAEVVAEWDEEPPPRFPQSADISPPD